MFTIDQALCTFCGGCSSVCPVMAIVVHGESSRIGAGCIVCGNCECFCPVYAVKREPADQAGPA